MNSELRKKAIVANICALAQVLDDAARRAEEAQEAISQGEQNQAIGAILGLEEHLQNALALHRAALALHRTGRAP